MVTNATARDAGISHSPAATATPKSHGARLRSALEAVDALPANAGIRSRFLEGASNGEASSSELAVIAEQDPAVALRLVRLANRKPDAPRGCVTTTQAIDALGSDRAQTALTRTPHYSLADTMDSWHDEVDRFRFHAIAVRGVAIDLARRLGERHPDHLALLALLHDVGKLVLARVYHGYADSIVHGSGPGARVALERASFGVDHAVIGGVVGRRWGLPNTLTDAIASHHADEAAGHAAIVRLADLVVHRRNGARIPLEDLVTAAARAGFPDDALSSILDQPPVVRATVERTEPCPLSPRQLEMVRALSEGKHYKEIAQGLGLSTSTIRSHLHQAYKRLHVTDRAQAVLLAVDRGWIGPRRVAPIGR